MDVESMTVDVEISVSDSVQDDYDLPETALLTRWAQAAYLNSIPAVVSILLTDADEMQQLNRKYRDKDKPTNVLSFPMQLPVEADVLLLGDIVLCVQVIKQEAEQQSRPELSHWAHMVVHGMLHLQGYDHINSDEAEEMERLEISILDKLGFNNPYIELTN
jgi:probable rRNA maturation factor